MAAHTPSAGTSKRALVFDDEKRASHRVTTAVKLGNRPEQVASRITAPTHAELVEERGLQQRAEEQARRKRVQQRLDNLEKTNTRDAAPGKSLYTAPIEGRHVLPANLAAILNARKEGGGPRERSAGYDAELQAAIKSVATGSRRARNMQEVCTPAVRKILSTKRTHASLIADATEYPSMHTPPNYFTAQAPQPSKPSAPLCSICDYWGHYACTQCGDRYCSRECGSVHDTTRCATRK